MHKPSPPRENRDLSYFSKATYKVLRLLHKNDLHGGHDTISALLYNHIYKIVQSRDGNDTDDTFAIVRQYLTDSEKETPDEYIGEHPSTPILVATTYLWRARQALENNDREAAWSNMAQACYWSGISAANLGSNQISTKTRKQIATKGALAKNKAYEQITAYAYKIVKERMPPKKGWPSFSYAAEQIESSVHEFSKTIAPQRKPVTKKTIATWLADMPNRDKYFPTK